MHSFTLGRAVGFMAALGILFPLMSCASRAADDDDSVTEDELRRACSVGDSCPSAMRLLSAKSYADGERPHRRFRSDIAIDTQNWDTTPRIMRQATSRPMTFTGGHAVTLSGDASGSMSVVVDNFILLEAMSLEGELLDVAFVGSSEPFTLAGQAVRQIGPDAFEHPAGELDISSVFPKGVPFRLRVTALDYGDLASVSDVYMHVSPGGWTQRYEAEAGVPANRVRGDYVTLWRDDTALEVDVPEDGVYELDVRGYRQWQGAAIDGTSDANAELGLFVGDACAGRLAFAGNADAPEQHALRVKLPKGKSTIKLAFLNDFYIQATGQDRNLLVDRVDVSHVSGATEPSLPDAAICATHNEYPDHTSVDPFDAASCQGQKITEAMVRAKFAPGELYARIGRFDVNARERECNSVTGCKSWSTLERIPFWTTTFNGTDRWSYAAPMQGTLSLYVDGDEVGLMMQTDRMQRHRPEVEYFQRYKCQFWGTPLRCVDVTDFVVRGKGATGGPFRIGPEGSSVTHYEGHLGPRCVRYFVQSRKNITKDKTRWTETETAYFGSF